MAAAHEQAGRWNSTVTTVLLLALTAFYAWTIHGPEKLRPGSYSDYYNLQVRGWLKGSLALDAEPHPDLRVEYPNRIVRHAPYLLDASYYEGRYYLYFGPTPALVLLLPFRLLTGLELSEPAAAVFFFGLGLLLSVRWYRELRQALPGGLAGPGASAALVACLGLVNLAPLALTRALTYEVAVAAGYAFTQACLLFGTRALREPERFGRWLLLASGSAALAIGSRPNLAVGAALALPVFALSAWSGSSRRTRADLLRALACAGIPALLGIGALLAYNQARFGQPLEFGNNLQLGANPQGFAFTWANVRHNLAIYYLTLPVLDWYFPFLTPGAEGVRPEGYFGIEEAIGQATLLPTLAAASVLGILGLRRDGVPARVRWSGLAALGWTVAVLLLVTASGVRSNRYMIDFQPVILVPVVAMLALGWARGSRAERALALGGAVGLAVTCLVNVLASFSATRQYRELAPASYARVERQANRWVWPFQQALGETPGPRALIIQWPEVLPVGTVQPILVTGDNAAYDALLVEFTAPDRARFLFEHHPHGAIVGPEFTVPAARRWNLHAELGTLFPPLGHPWYGDLPIAEQARVRTRFRLRLDDRLVLDAAAPSRAATLAGARLGERSVALRGEPRLAGRIEAGPPLPWSPTPSRFDGLIEDVQVTLGTVFIGQREPLLTFGSPQGTVGDAYFIEYLDAQTIRFGYDASGTLAFSPPVAVTYGVPLRLSLEFRPETVPGKLDAIFTVYLNGQSVWQTTGPNRAAPESGWIAFANPGYSSQVRQLFSGVVHRRVPEADWLDFLVQPGNGLPATFGDAVVRRYDPARLDAARFQGGVFDIKLRFPADRMGLAEPILTTGTPGAADGVYVRYVDPGHIVLGFDHWGSGGPVSPPIPIDYGRFHRLRIRLGPEGGESRIRLELDGAGVLDAPARFHPRPEATVRIGTNPSEMSTATAEFTGFIASVEPGSP